MMYKRWILIFSVWAGVTSVLSAQNYCSRATTSFAGGNYDEAIRYYNICMKDTERDLSGEIKRAERCKTLLVQAEAFREVNDYDHANQKYRELLALNPGDPVAKSRLTASAEAEVAASTSPREGTWTKVPVSGFQMNLDRTVDFFFSNGQAAYFVLSSHGDGYPVRKYDIASRSWTSPAILGRDFANSRTIFYMAPVINGVAYMAGLDVNPIGGREIKLKIMRYNMRSDAALPTLSIPLNVSLGVWPHISGGCAVGSKLVFILEYNQILTFDIGSGETKIYSPANGIISNQCAMFNFGSKVIIVNYYGLTVEFDPATSKYISKNGTGALASTSGFGYPVYGAPLGGRGYVLCLNHRTPQFREYNPATDAWRNLTLPVTGDVWDVYGFPVDASRMFIGIKTLGANSNPVWQYYIYEIK